MILIAVEFPPLLYPILLTYEDSYAIRIVSYPCDKREPCYSTQYSVLGTDYWYWVEETAYTGYHVVSKSISHHMVPIPRGGAWYFPFIRVWDPLGTLSSCPVVSQPLLGASKFPCSSQLLLDANTYWAVTKLNFLYLVLEKSVIVSGQFWQEKADSCLLDKPIVAKKLIGLTKLVVCHSIL